MSVEAVAPEILPESRNQLLPATRVKQATVKLDQVTIRDIELIALRKRLAEAEIQLAKLALQDALQKQKQVQLDETSMLELLEQKVGQKITGSIQLLDRENGICKIG